MDDLDALEALLAKATPGPWKAQEDLIVSLGKEIYDWRETRQGKPFKTRPQMLFDIGAEEYATEVDVALVVASVNALPDLLAELRRLRRVEEKARAVVDAAASPEADGDDAWLAEYAEAVYGPVEALRAALSEEPPRA